MLVLVLLLLFYFGWWWWCKQKSRLLLNFTYAIYLEKKIKYRDCYNSTTSTILEANQIDFKRIYLHFPLWPILNYTSCSIQMKTQSISEKDYNKFRGKKTKHIFNNNKQNQAKPPKKKKGRMRKWSHIQWKKHKRIKERKEWIFST